MTKSQYSLYLHLDFSKHVGSISQLYDAKLIKSILQMRKQTQGGEVPCPKFIQLNNG